MDYWLSIHVIETPGHTAEDLSHHATIGSNSVLFCGDTLLGAACGRIFDGSHRQLYHSLQKINTLPEHTQIYCVHEFTLSNLKFAEILEPDNNAIEQRIRDDTIK